MKISDEIFKSNRCQISLKTVKIFISLVFLEIDGGPKLLVLMTCR